MGFDIKKLSLSDETSNAEPDVALSLVNASQNHLSHAHRLVDELQSDKPAIWNRRERKEFEEGRRRLIRTKCETLNTQMEGILNQCRIATETATKATRIAAETLLNRLEEAAHVQREGFANAAYERVLTLGIQRINDILKVQDNLPEEVVIRELARCSRELEQNLQQIDRRAWHEIPAPAQVPKQ